jgi:ankyrin repeat protein
MPALGRQFLTNLRIIGSAAKTHDIFDWTPLHYASFLEDRSLLWRYFEPKQVRKHLSIHKTLGPFGRTPVHMAAISGSRAAMQWISKCLANTEDKKNAFEMVGLDGMSPLHLATKTGNHYMIEKMVRKRRIRATTSIDFWRRAAIHLAASHGHHGIATILLKDAQLDAVDDIGKTPLEYLLKNRGELQDTEEPKTDTTATLDDGKTAEDGLDGLGDGKDAVQGVADALHDKRDVTLEMISAEQPEPPEADTDIRSEQNLDDETSEVSSIKKREAAEQKRKIFLEFASRRSEYRDEKGRTFLYHAIEYTDVNTIEQLLSTGYKLEFRDTNGYTPLHFALWTDRPKVAIRLLQGLASQTADPSVKDEQGCTALMFAAMSGHINVVRFLVERESSSRQEAPATTEDTVKESEIDSSENAPKSSAEDYGTVATSSSGRTALHMALEYSQEEVALYLLNLPEGQVQVESCDSGRNTLLVTACRSILLSDSCKSTILEKWPRDINQPDSIYGQTPLSFACELGSSSVVDMLLAYDTLDINKPAKDWGDYTPLQAAVMNERASIVKKLLCQKSIDVNAKNSYGQTAVDMAGSNAEVAQVLLTHEQVDSKTRLSFMSQCCRSANQAVQEILPDILTLVSDGDITDKELIDLVYTSEESRSIVPHAAFVRRAFGRDTWKSIVHPYHKVARIGSLELADVLKEYGSDPTDLDDDGWSCIEYAETYQGSSLDAGLLRALQTAAAKPGDISKIKPPAALRYTHVESCVSLNSCKEAGHKDCDGIHGK